MALRCSPQATEAIRKSLPAITKGGVAVTGHFYKRMLGNNPQLKNIFNTANQIGMRQPQALFNSIAAAAGSAVNDKGDYGLPPIVVDLIAHKHCALNITEDQYEIVGRELIGTIIDLLKPGQDIIDGWAELYGKVVNVLASREKELYDQSERKPGGWRFKRDFIIEKRVRESSDITSFHFVPKDGGELPTHLPGQYTTVWVHPKDWEFGQPRHYTLSDTHSGKHFRISVRKEGLVSSWLHDHAKEGDVLPLSPPYGVFTLNPEIDEGDVVLLSADNGVTPVIAMLNSLLKKYEKTGLVRNVQWLHETQSRQTHPFREYLQDVGKTHKAFKGHVWYAQPDAEAVKGTDYHYEGRMNLEKHRAEIEKPTAHYYFCGPRVWMNSVREQLLSWGVPENRMHTEVFGPTLAEKHRP